MRIISLLFGGMIILAGCSNNTDKMVKDDPSAENLFYDYQVMAEEGDDSVTILLQYRAGGAEGEAVSFADGSIQLDGNPLQRDSAQNGTNFYEAVLPLNKFAGQHTVGVIDGKGKTHQQSFSFAPFALVAEMGEEMPKQPFTIRFVGLPTGSLVRLVLTDTSFASPDINEEMRVTGDSLRITQAMLNTVTSGPVVLRLQAETESPIKGNNKQGGRLLITYSLKREFELTQ